MSGKAKGEPSEGAASKAKVKQQIKTIVEDLELVLGDLKDVAKELKEPTPHKPDKDRCPQVTRERVRFSEQVQYHGYCPDCDVRYDIKNRDVHLHTETLHAKLKPLHHCPPPPPPLPSRENGGMGICVSHSFPPLTPTSVPPPAAPKPQKTILRKSTTTTV
ncbi:LARGN protein, partial [Polypterus senegalus]